MGDGIFNESVSFGGKNNLTTSSAIGGVTFLKNFNKSLSITTTLSGTYTYDKLTQERIFSNNVLEEIRWIRNQGKSLRISTQLNKKFSPGSLLRAGFIFSHRNYEIGQRFIDFTDIHFTQMAALGTFRPMHNGKKTWVKNLLSILVCTAFMPCSINGILLSHVQDYLIKFQKRKLLEQQ
jgi:hypothetical protein